MPLEAKKCKWCQNSHVPPWGNFCQTLLQTKRQSQAISRRRSVDNGNTVILPMSLLTHSVQKLHRENSKPEQIRNGSQPPKLAQLKRSRSAFQLTQMGESDDVSVQESMKDMTLLGEFENPQLSGNTPPEYELKISSPRALAFLRKLDDIESGSETDSLSHKMGKDGIPALAVIKKPKPMKKENLDTFEGFKRLRSASLPLIELHKAIEVQNQRHAREIDGKESDAQEEPDITIEPLNEYQRPRELNRAKELGGFRSKQLSVWRGAGVYNEAFELEELGTYGYNNEGNINPDSQYPNPGDTNRDNPQCNNFQVYINSLDGSGDVPESINSQRSSTDDTNCPNCQLFINPAGLEDSFVSNYTNPEASTSFRNHDSSSSGQASPEGTRNEIWAGATPEGLALKSRRAALEELKEEIKASTHPTPSPNTSPRSSRRKAPRRYSMGDMALEQYLRGEVLMHHGELLFTTMDALNEDQGLHDRDTLELGYPGPADKGLLKRQSNGGTHLDDVDILTHKPPGMMDAGPGDTRRDQPVRVELSVVYLKIGEIDTLKEHYEADVLIKAKWREPLLDKAKVGEVPSSVDWASYWNPKLFIENTIGEPRETAFHMFVHNAKGEAYIIEKRRVKGVFLENLELKDFPFDVQDLTVTVMSERSCLEIEIGEDPDDMHKVNKQSFIDEQEWHLYKCVETEIKEVTNEYSDPSIKRTALSVKCRAARRPAYFFWNIFLITFLICSLAFATFSVERGLPQNRLQLSFTLVLTSVAFKFVVNQSLPKISYLTYLDKYVLVAMILLTAVCAWHGLTSAIVLPDKEGKLLELVALIVFMGGYFLFNLIFVIRIYMRPGRKRRIMKFKERQYMEQMNIQMTRQKAMTLKQVADSPYITVI